jgi:hypothetical protein
MHWSPRRFLLANRDGTAAVSPSYKATPDYLHSCDIHFNLDWSWLLLGGSNSVDITVTSEIDGVVPPFEQTGTFTPSDPWKFVLTVPIWSNSIDIAFETNAGFDGSFSVQAALGKDIPVLINSFYEIPEILKEYPSTIKKREPVFWVRSLGVEGYRLRTIFMTEGEGGSMNLNFSTMYSGNGEWSEPLVIATADEIELMAGADLYGYPSVVFSDGDGNLRFKSTENEVDWDSYDRLIDTGADFNLSQLGFIQSDDEEDFIFWSKDNGLGVDHVYYCWNNSFTAYSFSAPASLGPAIAPSVDALPGADGLFLVMFDPQAPDIDSSVKLLQWIGDSDSFTPIDMPLDGVPGSPGDGLALEIGSFNDSPVLTLLAGSSLYWFAGLDSESITGHFAGEADLGGPPAAWVRPQVVSSTAAPGILFGGKIYQAADGSAETWLNPLPLNTPGHVADPDYTRLRSFGSGFFAIEFFDQQSGNLVIQGDLP